MGQREIMIFLDENPETWFTAKDIFEAIYPELEYSEHTTRLYRSLKKVVKRHEYLKKRIRNQKTMKIITLYKAMEE